MEKSYSIEVEQEMLKRWKELLDLSLTGIKFAKQEADYQPELDLVESYLIVLRQRMINYIRSYEKEIKGKNWS